MANVLLVAIKFKKERKCRKLPLRVRNDQRYAVLRCTSIDGFRLPDVGIRPTSVRISDYLHRIVDFYILVHLLFVHKISFCIVHCRTFIALQHERRFTLRLFNIGCKQLIESGFAKTLLHGSDTKELLFIWKQKVDGLSG